MNKSKKKIKTMLHLIAQAQAKLIMLYTADTDDEIANYSIEYAELMQELEQEHNSILPKDDKPNDEALVNEVFGVESNMMPPHYIKPFTAAIHSVIFENFY